MSSLTRDLAARLQRLKFPVVRSAHGGALYRLDGVPLWTIWCDESVDADGARKQFAGLASGTSGLHVFVFAAPAPGVLVEDIELMALVGKITSLQINAASRAWLERLLAIAQGAAVPAGTGRNRSRICELPLNDWLDLLRSWQEVGRPPPLLATSSPARVSGGVRLVARDYHAARLVVNAGRKRNR